MKHRYWRAWLRGVGRRLWSWRRVEREVEEELRHFMAMAADERRKDNPDQRAALRKVRAEMGGIEQMRQEIREKWPGYRLDTWRKDLFFAFRMVRKQPGFSAVVVLTMGIGIGLNTAIFSLLDSVFLRRPAVAQPSELVAVWTTCRSGVPRCSSSYPDYLDYRDRSESLQDLAAYAYETASLSFASGAQLITVQMVTGNYFGMLGVPPELGRLIQPEDDLKGAARRVAVLSHRLWKTQFGGDPSLEGAEIRINRAGFTVIGVAPAEFRGLHVDGEPDLYIPLLSGPALGTGFVVDDSRFSQRGSRWIDQLAGRMKPGVSLQQVRAEMRAISDQLAVEYPDERGPRKITVDAAEHHILPVGNEDNLESFMTLLLGVVLLALLLATANAANLLLARAAARRQEIGLRLALGSGRSRIVQQLVVESLTLSMLAGAAGLWLGQFLVSSLSAYELPGGVGVGFLQPQLNWRVFLYTLAITALAGLLFGLVPAFQATRVDLTGYLREAAWREGSGLTVSRLRRGLVAFQLALCMVLLIGSALFVQALRSGLEVDLGFPEEGLAVTSFDLSLLHYPAPEGQIFLDQLASRVEGIRGVESVGFGTRVPLLPGGSATFISRIFGYQPAQDEELRLEFNHVSVGYLEALGVELVSGRTFQRSDTLERPRSMVINQAMAQRWWRGRDPIGGRLEMGDRVFEIVGVVENTPWDDGLRTDPYPFAYLPIQAGSETPVSRPLAMLARSDRPPELLLPEIRREIEALEPDLGIERLTTMESLLGSALMPQRFGSALLSTLAGLALLLAVIGIYGVVRYMVVQRTRELGIRLALGAGRKQIFSLLFWWLAVPLGAGLLAGWGLSLALTRALEAFLLGISPTDPSTFLAIGGLLAGASSLTVFFPAYRAAGLSPVAALREN